MNNDIIILHDSPSKFILAIRRMKKYTTKRFDYPKSGQFVIQDAIVYRSGITFDHIALNRLIEELLYYHVPYKKIGMPETKVIYDAREQTRTIYWEYKQ